VSTRKPTTVEDVVGTDPDLRRKFDELLEAIASKHCAVETLRERGRSRLDFHDVAVGNLRAALVAAFEAGVGFALGAERHL
jgi:hypothetical protein